MPFCHVTLKGPKPLPPKYNKYLHSLGHHIRKKRLDLRLFQTEVAEQIGVSESTIYNWESNETSPSIRYLPLIIQFLGFNPFPAAASLPDRLKLCRKLLGLTQRAMAWRLGVDPTTLAKWERGRSRPTKKSRGHYRSFPYTSSCLTDECRARVSRCGNFAEWRDRTSPT